MSHTFTGQQVIDLEAVLSPPRFGTYLREVGGDRHKAMALYCWNTDISAAFYIMLQFCELSIRNGAVEAVEADNEEEIFADTEEQPAVGDSDTIAAYIPEVQPAEAAEPVKAAEEPLEDIGAVGGPSSLAGAVMQA